MSISIVEIPDGSGGSAQSLTDQDLTRAWRATSTSPSETPMTIKAQAGATLPEYLTPHPASLFHTCRSLSIQREIGAYIWLIRALYSTRPFSDYQRELAVQPNPVLRAARWWKTSQMYRKPIYRAIYVDDDTGATSEGSAYPIRAIVNSAGDPPDRAIEVDDDRAIIHFAKNYEQIPNWIHWINNRVNSAPFTILGWTFPARTLKAQGFAIPERQNEGSYRYYPVTGELHQRYDPDDLQETWDIRFPDAGYHYISSGDRKLILLDDDSRPSVVQLLDGSGGVLASPDTATAVYRRYRHYKQIDFSIFPQI